MESILRKKKGKDLITDNRHLFLGFLTKAFVFVSLICVIISVVSCSDGSGDKYKYDHIFDDLEGNSSTSSEDETVRYYYDVIVPSDASADIYEKARTLAARLFQKTGALSDVYYEYEMPESSACRTRIYVGELGLQMCRRFYKDFRINDYGYCYSEGAVLIGGVTDSATCEAIDKFISDILPKASLDSIMSEQDNFVYKAVYLSGERSLNGFALSEYTLVYPSGNAVALGFAELISEKIETTLGYSLAVCSENECDPMARSICIGKTARAGTDDALYSEIEAKILPYATGVSIVSESAFGMELAAERLLDMLCCDSESILIEDEVTVLFDKGNTRLICLSFDEPLLNLTKILNICSDIRNLAADVIRLDGLSDAYFDYIKRNLANTHFAHTVRGGEGKSIHYLYPRSERILEVGNISCSELTLDFGYFSNNGYIMGIVISDLTALAKTSVESAGTLGDELFSLDFERLVIFGRLYSDAEAAFLEALEGVERVYNKKLGIDMYVSGRTVTLGEVRTESSELFDLVDIEISYFSK